jgi:hypothetical protein
MPSDSHKARRSSRLASKVVTPLKDTPDHLEDDNSTEYDSLSQQKISSIFPPKVNAKSPSKVKAKAPSDCQKETINPPITINPPKPTLLLVFRNNHKAIPLLTGLEKRLEQKLLRQCNENLDKDFPKKEKAETTKRKEYTTQRQGGLFWIQLLGKHVVLLITMVLYLNLSCHIITKHQTTHKKGAL